MNHQTSRSPLFNQYPALSHRSGELPSPSDSEGYVTSRKCDTVILQCLTASACRSAPGHARPPGPRQPLRVLAQPWAERPRVLTQGILPRTLVCPPSTGEAWATSSLRDARLLRTNSPRTPANLPGSFEHVTATRHQRFLSSRLKCQCLKY